MACMPDCLWWSSRGLGDIQVHDEGKVISIVLDSVGRFGVRALTPRLHCELLPACWY